MAREDDGSRRRAPGPANHRSEPNPAGLLEEPRNPPVFMLQSREAG